MFMSGSFGHQAFCWFILVWRQISSSRSLQPFSEQFCCNFNACDWLYSWIASNNDSPCLQAALSDLWLSWALAPLHSCVPAAQHAQLEFPHVRVDHMKRHKKNRTVIDKTAETRERLNRASSCLSFCRSATHAWSLSLSFILCLPFSFHHCAATNTLFWQRLNCADTLECVGQNGRLVKAVVVYPLPE